MTTRRDFLSILGASLLAVPAGSLAQQKERVWRVGVLSSRKRPESLDSIPLGQFPRALRELGYIEGTNLAFVWRYAEGDYERLPVMAAELVKLPVDVIVTDGSPGIKAAQGATKTTPIVFNGGSDLVASGFVKSLARPGGNTTGVSIFLSDTAGKQIELLKGFVPGLARLAVLFNSANPAHAALTKSVQASAQSIDAQVLLLGVRTPKEVETAVSTASSQHVQALIWLVDIFLWDQRKQIADLSVKYRLPSMSGYPDYAAAGGLMGYGPDREALWRRVAAYVDKIFKGANPGDLPVEQPTKLDLVINRKTAKALGLEIPAELLLMADKVIE